MTGKAADDSLSTWAPVAHMADQGEGPLMALACPVTALASACSHLKSESVDGRS